MFQTYFKPSVFIVVCENVNVFENLLYHKQKSYRIIFNLCTVFFKKSLFLHEKFQHQQNFGGMRTKN